MKNEARAITNRGKKITKWGRDFKSREIDFKLRQRLQIGARWISNRCRDYESEPGLQIGAEHFI